MSDLAKKPTVLITDYAWPDIGIGKSVLESAGCHVIAGPAKPQVPALLCEHPNSIITPHVAFSSDAS